MSDAALSRIAHMIQVEDDLAKVQSLRQEFIKEKASIDVKLNNTSQVQIDTVTSNLKKLNDSANKLTSINANLNKINQIYEDSITNIPNYSTIQQMTAVNQYFAQVQNLYGDISNVKSYCDYINGMIKEELDQVTKDTSYTLPNLLKIHYNLTQVRNFQDYLERNSSTLTDDLKSIVKRIISPIRKIIIAFDELFKEIIISCTEALKEGNTELVCKLINIVEYETVEDLKLELMEKLSLDNSRDIRVIDYANFRGFKRNYHKFFFDKLKESLIETFEMCVEHFSQDKMLVFDNLNWLEDELVFVVDTLDPYFPANWGVCSFIENVYYDKLHNFTMEIVKTDPPAEDLLKILSYDSHYSKFVVALHTPSDEEVNPKKLSRNTINEKKSIIGDDLKNVVLEDYVAVIVAKMEEWNENLIQQETKTFIEREDPPDLYTYHQVIEDEDAQDNLILLEVDGEVYVLPDFKTPLTMLKEQADVAADSGYSKILVGVIENWSRCYIKRAINYQEVIEEEYDKYMSIYNNERYLIKESKTKRLFRRKAPEQPIDLDNMTSEELSEISRQGLMEYLTALGNTYEINTDRLQDKFLPNYMSKVHTAYQERIEQAFKDTLTPSTELNAQVIRTIVDIIVNDLYPALSTVFSKSWYDDGKSQKSDEPNMAEKIVETIAEYMEELRGYASYDIYLVTFNILLDTFISAYIRIGYENILHGSGKKIDPKAVKKFKSFSEGVGRDVTIFYEGLESLFTRKDSAYLLNSLRAIEFLGDLATCDDPLDFIPQMWENEILGSFYYCSVEYIRGICLCRKDMDKSTTNEVISHLITIQEDYHKSIEPPSLPTGTLNDFYYN
ncbi:uncharacterized protein PRCAT00001225001 [Priceomyces carsonii]|uniref:uncharacterized protein n=1 Tax=Priceomyces carsonii TaxID=28549 RepID=UPI002ED78FF9|nr:unnamed protein product [Priceomyces carsonii]